MCVQVDEPRGRRSRSCQLWLRTLDWWRSLLSRSNSTFIKVRAQEFSGAPRVGPSERSWPDPLAKRQTASGRFLE